jgi:hypothetical protein
MTSVIIETGPYKTFTVAVSLVIPDIDCGVVIFTELVIEPASISACFIV